MSVKISYLIKDKISSIPKDFRNSFYNLNYLGGLQRRLFDFRMQYNRLTSSITGKKINRSDLNKQYKGHINVV